MRQNCNKYVCNEYPLCSPSVSDNVSAVRANVGELELLQALMFRAECAAKKASHANRDGIRRKGAYGQRVRMGASADVPDALTLEDCQQHLRNMGKQCQPFVEMGMLKIVNCPLTRSVLNACVTSKCKSFPFSIGCANDAGKSKRTLR